jgi:hypothetical protein
MKQARSDLPLVEALLTTAPTIEQSNASIRWRRYETAEQRMYVIESLATTITRIERLDLQIKSDSLQIFSFVEVHTRQGEGSHTHIIDIVNSELMPVRVSRDDWIKAQAKVENLGDAKFMPIYNGQGNIRAIAFTTDWRVLAVQVSRKELQTTQNYQLQPERYVPTEDERGPLRPLGPLLADIRHNQRKLAARVDGMLGRIEAPPISDGNLLVPLWDAPELAPLLGLLSDEQKQVLEAVQRQIWVNADQTLKVPQHFVGADLQLELPNAVMYQTLDLLERVGLIVRVTLPVDEHERIDEQKRIDAYRLTHKRDHWQVPETATQE